MPFFIVEFSLAPSRLTTHYDPTNQANLPPLDNGKVATGSNANVRGVNMEKKVAVSVAGQQASG